MLAGAYPSFAVLAEFPWVTGQTRTPGPLEAFVVAPCCLFAYFERAGPFVADSFAVAVVAGDASVEGAYAGAFAEAIAGDASVVDAFAVPFVADTFVGRAVAFAAAEDAFERDAFADALAVAFVAGSATLVVVVVAVGPSLSCMNLSNSRDFAPPLGS